MYNTLLQVLKDWVIWTSNTLIEFIALFLDEINELLPSCTPDWNGLLTESPVSLNQINGYAGDILGFIAWIFPLATLASALAFIVCNLGFYFTVGILMRWAKVSS